MCLITAQKYVFYYNYPKKTKEKNVFLCKIVKYYAQNKYSLGLNSLSATSYLVSYVYIKQFFCTIRNASLCINNIISSSQRYFKI